MVREEEFRKYNLLTLREVARQNGVQSPTSKRKFQLIKEIVDIKNGKQQPTATKLGRKPSKSLFSEDFNKCDLCVNKKNKKANEISSNEFALILKGNISNLLSLL